MSDKDSTREAEDYLITVMIQYGSSVVWRISPIAMRT